MKLLGFANEAIANPLGRIEMVRFVFTCEDLTVKMSSGDSVFWGLETGQPGRSLLLLLRAEMMKS